MANPPDLIVLRRHRDLEGRRNERWLRRGILAVIAAFVALGLVNLYGQRPESSVAGTDRASLTVKAPSRVRGGLLYEARFTIEAHRELAKAILVLADGWAEGSTINTIEPSPIDEASRNGLLSLELGHVPAGEKFVLFMQFQVNPTTVGHRSQDVALFDGDTHLLTIRRSITVFP